MAVKILSKMEIRTFSLKGEKKRNEKRSAIANNVRQLRIFLSVAIVTEYWILS